MRPTTFTYKEDLNDVVQFLLATGQYLFGAVGFFLAILAITIHYFTALAARAMLWFARKRSVYKGEGIGFLEMSGSEILMSLISTLFPAPVYHIRAIDEAAALSGEAGSPSDQGSSSSSDEQEQGNTGTDKPTPSESTQIMATTGNTGSTEAKPLT